MARNATFLEKEFLTQGVSGNKVELEEVQETLQPAPIQEHPESIQEQPESSVPQPLRRSSRIICPPERYNWMISEDGQVVEESHNDEDPTTFQEAIQSRDSDKWLKAMETEVDSMWINKVWTLIEPSEGSKPISCKWIFKKKIGANENIETYKARLVAKGYHQR